MNKNKNTFLKTIDNLRGTGVALVTPFDKTGKVDFKSLEKLVNHCINGGLDYLVVLGTTGETPTLSFDEKIAIANCVKNTNNGRVSLVIGIGGNNTFALLDFMKKFDFEGFEAILSASPNYNKPSQTGIYQHYKSLSEAAPKPIILYNVPSRTGSNMMAQTSLKLANDFENIIAIKEASGNIAQCMEIAKNRPENFLLISGDDAITLPLISFGGDGVISVIANAYPKEMSAIYRACQVGNYDLAKINHFKLLEITNAIFEDGNPGGIKYLLSLLGICENHLRLPLVEINQNLKEKIKILCKKLH